LADLVSKAVPPSSLESISTGGSTGIPLQFFIEKNVTYEKTLAYEWRQYNWGGVAYFDRRVRIRGLVLDNIYKKAGHNLYLSALHLTRSNVEDYIHLMEEFSPVYIEAYPSSIILISQWLLDTGYVPHLPHLKSVFLSSETVSEAEQNLIRKCFRCLVLNKYGNSEQATIIGQCERGAMHDFEEYSLTEFLDENGLEVNQGESELISTSFVNFATFFIRYRTGDLVDAGSPSCDCGRSHRTVNRIIGRSQDYLIGKHGEHISVAAINSHSDAFNGLLEIQYVQDQPGQAVIKVVASNALRVAQKNKMVEEATYRAAGNVQFSLQEVDAIEKSSRGKKKFILRRMNE
jgi:phenylacetate-CoA ligase